MKPYRAVLATLVVYLLPMLSAVGAKEPAHPFKQLAFTDVTVVDVSNGELRTDRTVLVEGNRIAAVGPADSVKIPRGARIVDGTGKFLIPGLWDMHTHLLWSTDASEHFWNEMPEGVDSWTLWKRYYGPTLDLLVANGVTSIREMWGNLDVARRVRQDAEAGERLAPRMVVAGHHLTGKHVTYPGQLKVKSPQAGRNVVDSLVAAGANFIKVHNKLKRDVYLAMARQASEIDIPLAGHVPWLVPAVLASDAGQRSIEHVTGIVQGCSSEEADLIDLNREIIDAGDEAKADSLNVE